MRSTSNPFGVMMAAVLLGCAAPSAQAPSPPVPTQAPPPGAPAPAAATAPAENGAPEGAFAGCAANIGEGLTRELTLAGRKATQTGARLRFTEPDLDGQLVIGVLGPINEDSGLNLLALRKYLAFFTEHQAEAVVVTGDSGETPSSMDRMLKELSAAGLPVLVASGNRECKEDFNQGVALAQTRFDGIVNLNAIRSVELGGMTFVSLPGYHDPNYITCETGCRYDDRTLADVITLAKEARTPVVLVSHGPPRGASSQSLDYATSAGNVGDPQVNKVITEGKIAFGLFSNIKEAGGRATAADLATQIPEGKSVKTLMLNPGAADTSRWEMNGGWASFGSAAVVTYSKGKASWKLFKAPKPTAEEKKAAKALEPARTPKPNKKPKPTAP
ncbi:MAG: hypothetical protein M3Y59_05305 [Myxococcota bacterium]|nr:hypothetical protein [Myxococcota bacterium]